MRKLTSITQFCITSILFSDDRLIEARISPNCNLFYRNTKEKCIKKKRCKYLRKQCI